MMYSIDYIDCRIEYSIVLWLHKHTHTMLLVRRLTKICLSVCLSSCFVCVCANRVQGAHHLAIAVVFTVLIKKKIVPLLLLLLLLIIWWLYVWFSLPSIKCLNFHFFKYITITIKLPAICDLMISLSIRQAKHRTNHYWELTLISSLFFSFLPSVERYYCHMFICLYFVSFCFEFFFCCRND